MMVSILDEEGLLFELLHSLLYDVDAVCLHFAQEYRVAAPAYAPSFSAVAIKLPTKVMISLDRRLVMSSGTR